MPVPMVTRLEPLRKRCASRVRVGSLSSRATKFNGIIGTLLFREGELLFGATLALTPDDPAENSWRGWKTQRARRLATQPHGRRSAGCFFKNPPESAIGTGKMIDDMGMKGVRKGTRCLAGARKFHCY